MPKVTSGIRDTVEQKREKERIRKQIQRDKKREQPKGIQPKRTAMSRDERLEKDRVRKQTYRANKQAIEDDNDEKLKKTFFIAIDGEGVEDKSVENFTYIDDNGDTVISEYQKYVLLCASTGETLYMQEGIDTCSALSWLCNLSLKYPDATFVIYGGSYDTTMWLRDLSFSHLLELRSYMKLNEKERIEQKVPHPSVCATVDDVPNTHYVIFEYEYLPRKECKIIRFEAEKQELSPNHLFYRRDSRGKRIRHGSFRVWDVIGFFQQRFMDALKEYGLLESEADETFLQNMKDARGQFERLPIETITDYCHKECQYLVKLMEKMEEYLHHPAINLQLKRWDGAGAIAAALLKQQGVKDHLEDLPPDVLTAALHAYSGGRIELIQYGHKAGKTMSEIDARLAVITMLEHSNSLINEETINNLLANTFVAENGQFTEKILYDYDINSAYPTTMCNLPSLAGGMWKLETEVKSSFALCHVRWDLSGQRIYPFFYRTQKSTIIYPEKGENWHWLPEYEVALKHQDKYHGSIELIEVWNFYPAIDVKPFSFIPDMAKQRLKWKDDFKKSGGIEGGQNKVIKLGLNSLYGKTAQQIGGSYNKAEDKMELPSFHNIGYAGYITASTRAKLYDTAMYNPNSVVMFATDGLFTTELFPHLPLSSELGEWEVTACTSFTAVQSGVYYLVNENQKRNVKSRGFEKDSITEEMVLEAWNKGQRKRDSFKKGDGYEVVGTSRQFITFGLIATGQKTAVIKKGMARLCCWETRKRKLSLSPYGTKRDNDPHYHPRTNPKKFNPSKRFIPTLPAHNDDYVIDGHISKLYHYAYLLDLDSLSTEEREYIIDREEQEEYRTQ